MNSNDKVRDEFDEIVRFIEEARQNSFRKVNEGLILLYYKVGNVVSVRVAEGAWGNNTVGELAKYIGQKFPGLSGFNTRGLYRMKQFFELYSPVSDCFLLWQHVTESFSNNSTIAFSLPDKQENLSPPATPFNRQHLSLPVNLSPPATQLQNTHNQHDVFMQSVLSQIPWSHHIETFSLKTNEERLFYLFLCVREKLTKQELRRQIKSAVFERSMISNVQTVQAKNNLPGQFFKDPYIFEFLDLPDVHAEKDLEKAIILNLKNFILEIGKGFAYMGNQFKLQVGNKDYFTDLLFYHRDLQCLVMFELKISEFEPEFLGKLNFYLEALDRDVKRLHENPSIGVLLCKGKNSEVVEYALSRNISPAVIADYETKLISKETLTNKLHQWAMMFPENDE